MGIKFSNSLSQVLRYDGTQRITALPVTVSAWIFLEQYVNGNVFFLGDKDTYNKYIECGVTSAGAAKGTSRNDDVTFTSAVTSNVCTLGQWNHLFFTSTGGAANTTVLNCDFANKGTSTTVAATAIDRFSIGSQDDSLSGSPFLDHAIADLAVWNYVLEDSECILLSRGANPRDIRAHRLKYHYPMFNGELNNFIGPSLTRINGGGRIYGNPPHMVRTNRRFYPIIVAASGSIQTGDGSSAGVATVNGTGASVATSAASSDGVAAVNGTGISIAESAGASDGVATAAGTGASVAESVGASAGVATAGGVGASVAESVGNSAGVATVAGTGDSAADGQGTGTSAGTGSVGGVGASVAATASTVAGTSTAAAVGASTAETASTVNGVASVNGVGASDFNSVGSSAGVASVNGVGSSGGTSSGESDGVATVSGVGAAIAESVGSASGTSTVSGVGDSEGGSGPPRLKVISSDLTNSGVTGSDRARTGGIAATDANAA